MVSSAGNPEDRIERTLADLRAHIADRVRLEQLRDQLTGLPNDRALSETIESMLDGKKHLWIAFIEIDRFKWINDRFGYQNADVLLVRIAEVLQNSFASFLGSATAFRPHGDEFYLLGEWGEGGESEHARLVERLDLIKRNVASLSIKTQSQGVMSCKVSVGWLDTASLEPILAERSTVLVAREIMVALERAVAEAKTSGDCVVQYSRELSADVPVPLRSSCSTCFSKIQISVKRSRAKDEGAWRCPNCHADVDRPPLPSS